MRFPKPWSKKRGKRFAGRALSGTVGEAVFFAVLFLVGVFSLALTVAQYFVLVSGPAFPTGLGFWILIVLSVALVVTGGGALAFGILQIGASSERRSALARRAGELELIRAHQREALELPMVPRGANLTDSPGVRLTYRLPSTGWPGWRLASAAVLALMWNGGWLLLLVVVITGFQQGQPRWVLAGLLLPFAVIGVGAFRYFLARFREMSGLGATIVEISDHPLLPGESYRGYVAQFGRMTLRKLQVELVCEEESTYRQGTDIRVEKKTVRCEKVVSERGIAIDRKRPWEREFSFTVPPDVMHSFRSPHNAVRWKIVVTGESRPWPSFCQSFPVVVQPGSTPPRRSPR